MGFTKRGGTQMQITQRCSSGDKTEVVVLVVVVIHTVLLHISPCTSLEQPSQGSLCPDWPPQLQH